MINRKREFVFGAGSSKHATDVLCCSFGPPVLGGDGEAASFLASSGIPWEILTGGEGGARGFAQSMVSAFNGTNAEALVNSPERVDRCSYVMIFLCVDK